jgi:lysyl-tRNA synthetase class 2
MPPTANIAGFRMDNIATSSVGSAELSKIVRFKADLIWGIRKFLHEKDAIEVTMPILQRTREGAPMDQWSSNNPYDGERWYLRHCMEDHLRRTAAAHPRVFEIGKAIRAERSDASHAHEFVVLELVFLELNYADGVSLVREMFAGPVADAIAEHYETADRFRQIRVKPWHEVLTEQTGLVVREGDLIGRCKEVLARRGVVPERPYSVDWEVLEDIMKHVVEPACVEPTIITHFPKELQHVCQIGTDTGRALRLSTVVDGVEISDGGVKFHQSNEYRRIYEENARYRRDVLGLDGNALPEEFFADLDALSTAAFTSGVGIDRIVSLVHGCHINRALIFPEG